MRARVARTHTRGTCWLRPKAVLDHLTGLYISLAVHAVLLFLAFKYLAICYDSGNMRGIDIEVSVIDLPAKIIGGISESMQLKEYEDEAASELEKNESIEIPELAFKEIDIHVENASQGAVSALTMDGKPDPVNGKIVASASTLADLADSSLLAETNVSSGDVKSAASTSREETSNVRPRGLSKPHMARNCEYRNTDAGKRALALAEFGGDDSTESAVIKALEWLETQQMLDGHWGERYPKAMTALALMCFLAHGETARSGVYGKCVEKAMRWLCYVDSSGEYPEYQVAISAYGLSEAYALTHDPMAQNAMNRSIAKIMAGQNVIGGFDYGYKLESGRCDLSIGGWNYQALASAKTAGCSIPGLDQAIRKSILCLKTRSYKGNGNFLYDYGDSGKTDLPKRLTMNSIGVLSLQLMDQCDSNAVASGLANLDSLVSVKTEMSKESAGITFYTMYYLTQALFQGHAGKGNGWQKWNRWMKNVLTDLQAEKGFWELSEHEKCNFEYESEGRIYSTSLACLCLEIYYRHLPSFRLKTEMAGKEEDIYPICAEIINFNFNGALASLGNLDRPRHQDDYSTIKTAIGLLSGLDRAILDIMGKKMAVSYIWSHSPRIGNAVKHIRS